MADHDLKFKRWQDFAVRMARACWTNRNRPSRDWIVQSVQDFFDGLREGDRVCWVSWDNSLPYPEGHPDRGVEFYGHLKRPYPMCDEMSEWESLIWDQPSEYMTRHEYRRWQRLDDDAGDELRQTVVERWADPVRCCVRAGMDCAYEPSMGVLGFSAGDLRRMYPEGVPDWVTNGMWETVPIEGVCPGVGFIPGAPHSPKPFDQLDDEQAIWI